MDGIFIPRNELNDEIWLSEEFTRAQAWIDLVGLAARKPKVEIIRGINVSIGVGQLSAPIGMLCERWKWSRRKVENFIEQLESEKQITTQKSNVTTLLSIYAYDRYVVKEVKSEKQNTKQNASKTEQLKLIDEPAKTHKLQDYIRTHYKKILKLPKQLTFEQAEELEAKYTGRFHVIKDMLDNMEDYPKLLKSGESVHRILIRWLRNDEARKGEKTQDATKPASERPELKMEKPD